MDRWDAHRLRQEHRGEFPNPDHSNPNWVPGGGAFLQLLEEIHRDTLRAGFSRLREEIEIAAIWSLKDRLFVKRAVATFVPLDRDKFA